MQTIFKGEPWYLLNDTVNRNLGFLSLWTRAMDGELAVKHGCCSSPSLDARPPRLMWMDSRMPRWHGCQRAAMGRTVVSLITMAHLF